MKIKCLSSFFGGRIKNGTNDFSVIIRSRRNPFANNIIYVPTINSKNLTRLENFIF